MKNIITLVIVYILTYCPLKAQPFEGTIKYHVQYEVIEKERPDLEVYKNMVPSEMKMSIKGPSSLLQFTGGAAEGVLGDILYKTADKTIYSIFHSTKTYTKTPIASIETNKEKSLKAIKTDSAKTILGFSCLKYVIKDEKEGTETFLWTTPAIRSSSSKIMSYFLGSMTEIGVSGIEGLPLEISFTGGEFSLTIKAYEKELKNLPLTQLSVPKTYKLTKADPQLE